MPYVKTLWKDACMPDVDEKMRAIVKEADEKIKRI